MISSWLHARWRFSTITQPATLAASLALLLPTQSLAQTRTSSASATKEIAVGEFVTLPIAFHSLSKQPLVKLSDIQRTLDTKLAAVSELQLQPIPDAKVQACINGSRYGRMQCLVREARPEYDDTDAKAAKNPGELRQALQQKRGGARTSKYLLVVFSRTEGSGERLSFFMVDTRAALEAIYRMVRSPEGATLSNIDRAEGEIIQTAIGAQGRSEASLVSQAQLEPVLSRVFSSLVLPAVRAGEHADRFGRVRIHSNLAGAELSVDGKVLGTLALGFTLVTQLQPGTRRISLSRAGYYPIERTVEPSPNETVELSADFVPEANTIATYTQQVTLWAGVVSAIAGGVVLGAHFGQRRPEIQVRCVTRDAPCAPPPSSKQLSAVRDQIEVGQLRAGKVPASVLGGSLIGMGVIWSVGTLIFSDEDHIPWIELATGLVLGGTAIAVSVFANGNQF